MNNRKWLSVLILSSIRCTESTCLGRITDGVGGTTRRQSVPILSEFVEGRRTRDDGDDSNWHHWKGDMASERTTSSRAALLNPTDDHSSLSI
jgi:hypothetical protein